MKLKRAEFYEIMNGILKLKEEKLGVRIAYTLIKNFKKIEEDSKITDEIKDKLVKNITENYAVKKEDGTLIKANNVFGMEINKDKMDEAMEHHNEYVKHLNEEIEIDLQKISLDDLGDINIPVSVLSDIDKIIEEENNEC